MMITDSENPIKFSILIPAFNEENNIIPTIQETRKVLDALKEPYEITIIDDGSTDDTYNKVIGSSAGQNNVKIYKYSPNRGKGFALRYGTGYLSGEYVLFLDADLDLHPSHISGMLKIMQDNGADVVIGSKMHKDSNLYYPAFRKFLSASYYFFIKILFKLPFKDTQTGLKLFRSVVLKECIQKVKVERYAFDLELLLYINKKGYKIMEAPVFLKTNRAYARVGFQDAFKVLFDTIAVFWRFYFRKYYN